MKAKLEAKVEMEKRDKRSKAKKWVCLFLFPSLPYSRVFSRLTSVWEKWETRK